MNLAVFVEYSGFLGYLALFIMSSLSIAVRRPYTLQVSKRDYPPSYWGDRTFIRINSLITAVWAVIFLANASMFLLMPLPFLPQVLSILLVVAGIIFSIIFPLKAPAYFVSRHVKGYGWRVEVSPGSSKGEGEFDVAIVGAGIGGLACGALLAKRGYRVLVLEQHSQVGGYCSSFSRRGFTFNAGVEDISGLWEGGPVNRLLRELGLEPQDYFVRNRVRYIFKGIEVEAGSLEEFIDRLSQRFPSEREGLLRFFDEAKLAYRECYREAQIYGAPLPSSLIVKVLGAEKLAAYPAEHPHFYDWMGKTYMEKLDEHIRDRGLKELLCGLTGYLGTSPRKTPAARALTACLSYYIHGGYFPKGGAQRFAEALKSYIEGNGGHVFTKTRVDRILVEEGKAAGVRAGRRRFRSPIVVANANARTVMLELVGEEYLPSTYAEWMRGLRMGPSAFMVFLGLDMDLSGYPTLIKDLDRGLDIVINSNADSSLAPEGQASVTLITLARYQDFPPRDTEEYKRRKREKTQELIRKAEGAIPGLTGRIVIMDAATPRTLERYTSMPEGALYSFDQSAGSERPYFKTPVRGLYLVGSSTFPGGGIEAVVISGVICANDICEWKV